MLLIAAFALAAPRYANLNPIKVGGMLAHPKRLIVHLESKAVLKDSKSMHVLWRFDSIGFAAIELEGDSLAKQKSALERQPGILDVEFDRCALPAYDPNDPLWNQMWHSRTLHIDTAWDLSLGSPTKVAVIDTGVNTAHEDLSGNIWTNPGEIPGNGIDDDHNGYVDDVHGYDFAYGDSIPDDQFGHGSACAGLVGAVQDNSIGVTGAAPRARIVCLKASNDSGYFYDSMTIPAYMYGADNGVRVFSMSFFSDHVSPGERTAMDYAVSHGVLPVCAAGNASSTIPYYPGAYENVLSVAALNPNNSKAGFSNYGTWVDVAAPGVQLVTTTGGGGYTTGFAGTSGACPQIAGIATLLFGARPSATAAQVRAAVEDTASDVGSFVNYGLVDARAALNALLATAAAPKTPKFAYMTPAGLDTSLDLLSEQVVRIYGRGFQLPTSVAVTINGEAVPLIAQTRDYVDVALGPVRGNVQLKVAGSTVATISLPTDQRKVYSGIEGSSPGAAVSGGFLQMLRADSSELTCSDNNGNISLESNFRSVKKKPNMQLCVTRRYTGTSTGSEAIYLYDWSSASYPYGNWVQVGSSATLPSTSTTSYYNVGNAGRFVDDEGTVYCLVTASGVEGGGTLRLDQLNYIVL